MTHKVLLIGGTGVFGTRLAHHLAGNSDIALTITSRSQSGAEVQARKIGSGVSGIGLNTADNLDEALATTKPFAVVDCSGPFQNAGYEIANAVISSGAHMIDLADARNYLLGYTENLDVLAKSNGVTALAGASSTPALSGAVVRSITQNWKNVDSIDICITPGGRSEVGRSVIEAILSYAGRDIATWRNGQLQWIKAWVGSRKVQMPGLGTRRVASVETADAELFGAAFPGISSVSFSAGLESSVEQRGLQTIARLRSWGVFPNPKPFVPLLLELRKVTRIPTSDSGGMLVEATGLDSDELPVHVQWSLVARNDHGPNVPILAAAAAVRALVGGDLKPGARIASEYITFEQIEAEMKPYAITTQTKCSPIQTP